MSNSPGLRGGEIGSAIPKSFSLSPNCGLPRQRTNSVAFVRSVFPSNWIDANLSRNVAKPFDAIFGSEATTPTALTTRDRSLRSVASRKPDVSPVRKLWRRKNPMPTRKYVDPRFGQEKNASATKANVIALNHHLDAAIGKKSATTIPIAAIKARPTNGCRGIFTGGKQQALSNTTSDRLSSSLGRGDCPQSPPT